MIVRVYPDLESLSRAAAELFVQTASKAVTEDGRFSVVLSGGSTPTRLYELLATSEYSDAVPWAKTYVFWGDERCVPLNDPLNNAHNALHTFLYKVPLAPDQVYRIESDKSPHEAAQRYEAALREYFGDNPPCFDLIFLGLGENGHTASLFPGTPILNETKSWVADVYVAEQKMYRVSMTTSIINQASRIVFLVSGMKKANVLREVIESTNVGSQMPASLIAPVRGELYWFCDREAAALLDEQNVEMS
jgi:6-phosphogluconolactonase